MLELHRHVGARSLVETRALVVVAMCDEQPSTSPDLNRTRLDVEAFGDLAFLQETAFAQARVSIGQLIFVANARDAIRMKRLASSRRHAAFVEQLRDLGIGVIVE